MVHYDIVLVLSTKVLIPSHMAARGGEPCRRRVVRIGTLIIARQGGFLVLRILSRNQS